MRCIIAIVQRNAIQNCKCGTLFFAVIFAIEMFLFPLIQLGHILNILMNSKRSRHFCSFYFCCCPLSIRSNSNESTDFVFRVLFAFGRLALETMYFPFENVRNCWTRRMQPRNEINSLVRQVKMLPKIDWKKNRIEFKTQRAPTTKQIIEFTLRAFEKCESKNVQLFALNASHLMLMASYFWIQTFCFRYVAPNAGQFVIYCVLCFRTHTSAIERSIYSAATGTLSVTLAPAQLSDRWCAFHLALAFLIFRIFSRSPSHSNCFLLRISPRMPPFSSFLADEPHRQRDRAQTNREPEFQRAAKLWRRHGKRKKTNVIRLRERATRARWALAANREREREADKLWISELRNANAFASRSRCALCVDVLKFSVALQCIR